MTKADPCRFCRIYAIALVAFAALIGAVTMLQFMLSVGVLAGASSVLVLSAVRSLAPGASGSALLLALVLWAHPLTLEQLKLDLRRILTRALVVSVPGYLVAVVVAITLSFGIALGFGQSWTNLRQGFSILRAGDVAVGLLATLVDAALVIFLGWRYLARLQAGRMSLPAKLVVVLTFSVGLRVTVALVLSLLLAA